MKMIFPTSKKIAVMSTPPTYTGDRLCHLGLIPITALKIVAFLKKTGNQAAFINLHPGDYNSPNYREKTTLWKFKKGGAEGKRKFRMKIHGLGPELLPELLKELPFVPDELWITCSFTFDYDLVAEYIKYARKARPDIRIGVGGDFIRTIPGLAKKIGADFYYVGKIDEIDSCEPDFDSVKKWNYGLFQLQTGCVNKCSFCLIGLDKPRKFSPEKVLAYMKEFYEKNNPAHFWNWDPNVVMFRKTLEEFLDLYAESGIPATINFMKGLQPNLLDEKLLKKLVNANTMRATFPMESATYAMCSNMNKPYTIISSVKLLAMAKEAGMRMKECPCSFLMGYPDDDFRSFFRIFLSALHYGALPSPFPVFLFPGSPDYLKYSAIMKTKDYSELHGQLWPLLPEKDLDKYINLLTFVRNINPGKITENIKLLAPDLKGIFLDELEKYEKFVNLCLSAKKDNIEELGKIEKELSMKNTKKNRTLLMILADPGESASSASKKLAGIFSENYRKNYPGATVKTVDLRNEKMEFINQEFVDVVLKNRDASKISKKTRDLLAFADRHIKLIDDADAVLVASPMYTLTIPSILKCYFEIIASRLWYYYGKTFESKPSVCISTRGGSYPKNGVPYKKGYLFMNAQEITLDAIFDFLGLSSKIKHISCEKRDSKNESVLKEGFEKAVKEIEAVFLKKGD